MLKTLLCKLTELFSLPNTLINKLSPGTTFLDAFQPCHPSPSSCLSSFCSYLKLRTSFISIICLFVPQDLDLLLVTHIGDQLCAVVRASFLSFLSPTGSDVIWAFLPELTLSFAIIYLLGMIAYELAGGTAPKVLATKC
jgi:hypothetical protein